MNRSTYILTIVVTLLLAAASPAVALPTNIPAPEHEYLVYGNTYLGDCTVASAADWSVIQFGGSPSPDQEVRLDFYEAGGTQHGGLSTELLFGWWASHGFDHHRVLFAETPTTRQATEEAIAKYKEALVVVTLHRGEFVGATEPDKEGVHMMVLDGYTPAGPDVVTWGFTTSITWAQWEHDAMNSYIPKAVISLLPTKKHHRIHLHNFEKEAHHAHH